MTVLLLMAMMFVRMFMTVRMVMTLTVCVFAMLMFNMFGGFRELAININVDLGRVNTAAVYTMNVELSADVERMRSLLQKVYWNASSEQRSEQHVPADIGEAF